MSNRTRPLNCDAENRICQALTQAQGITQTLQWGLQSPAEDWHQEHAINALWAVDDLLKESIDLLCKEPEEPTETRIPVSGNKLDQMFPVAKGVDRRPLIRAWCEEFTPLELISLRAHMDELMEARKAGGGDE